jgi:glycosyltransferase involved in cell wall biosynthesis
MCIMTIGIDARMLGKGFGLARYIEELLKQLDAQETEHTFVVFLRSESIGIFKPVHAERFRFVIADIPWYSVGEQLLFPRIIRREHLDLMHFPHFNVPLLYTRKFLVTIHDLTMFHFPRPEATTRSKLVFWIKDVAHRYVIRSAVRRAAHIMTTSEYVRHDVHDTLGVPLSNMSTVYQAPFAAVSKRNTPAPSMIDAPYMLYVGASYPHKNVEGLLDAWEEYIDAFGGEETLVLVGKENYFWERLLPRIESMTQVVYLGFQTDEELASLYAHARAFVFPSLSEGFGIPPLEAMQQGIAVLSSNASCLPEVLGEGVLYTDTTNPEMFASAIDSILHNEDIRYEVLVAAKEVLARYSSDKFGTETITIYNNTL